MSLLELPGKRVTLKILSPEDAPLVQSFMLENRDHLAPWEPSREESAYELNAIQTRLTKSAADYKAGAAFQFAVIDNFSGSMIGTCNFSNIVRGVFQACHLGYAISHTHQGKGLMSEAVEIGIIYMFEIVKLHRIMANYMPRNERSAKLLEKLGFEREGYAKSYLKIAGVWEDHILTSKINPRQS
jgi:[ribosomal protein S5]-alanine N-acetyltransferase